MTRRRASSPKTHLLTNGETPRLSSSPSSSHPRPTELYVARCNAYGMRPDPAVLTCLETKWHVLALSPEYVHEGALLPLMEILEGNAAPEIQTCRVVPGPALREARQATHSGDVDARALRRILTYNTSIRNLDLSHLALGPLGIEEIAAAVKVNTRLERLTLAHNSINLGVCEDNRRAYAKLALAIRHHPTLRHLDVSYNHLGYTTVANLRRHAPAGCVVRGEGNHVVEESLNFVSHGLGFLVAVVAVLALLWHVRGGGRRLVWTCVIYSLCLLAMFFTSSIFHLSTFHSAERYAVMKVMDHSTIYFLIAGSAGPFLHVALKGLPDQTPVLLTAAAQWIIAISGTTLGAYSTHHVIPYRMSIELVLYFTQGLAVFPLRHELAAALGRECVDILLITGLTYFVGAFFFLAEHTVHPVGHSIWHLFVIVGVWLHYWALLTLVDAEMRGALA